MAKTHFTGIAVGPPGGPYSNVQLVASVTITATGAGGRKQVEFPTPALLIGVTVLSSAGAPVAVTAGDLKIGTTAGGTEVFAAAVVVTGMTSIALKKVTGTVYLEAAAAVTVPVTVLLQYIPLD